MKQLAVLGSTGSVGTQVLDVARSFPERIKITALSAGNNHELLQEQVSEFKPAYAICNNREQVSEMRGVQCISIEEMAALPDVDTVVVATVGIAGLKPTFVALEAGKRVALANKEVLIMAGELLMSASRKFNNPILPIDSEPSAIWQCITGEGKQFKRLVITASGGAFRNRDWKDLENVTPQEALQHPTWRMGHKITIDSATLVNKAFEVIEAHWLFGTPYKDIDVVIHPQSIVHSMVEFEDGSVKAHLGPPDMRYPIQYALFYPQRITNKSLPRFNPVESPALTFDVMDPKLYPCFEIAINYGKRCGTWPAALVGADGAAVEMFLTGRIKFTEIPDLIQSTLVDHRPINNPNLFEVNQAAEWATNHARRAVGLS